MGQGRPPAIVFIAPSTAELDKELRDALTAQLSGASAELVFEHFAAEGASLRRQMQEASAIARAHSAAGVFWLDPQPDGDWLLYFVDPDGNRMLVRRIDAPAISAGVEAVAVITRQSIDALLAGGTIGMQSVPKSQASAVPPSQPAAPLEPHPTKPPDSNQPSPPFFSGLSFSAAYFGDLPASEIGWQSGLAIGVGYRFSPGFYVDAGYTLLPGVEVVSDPIVLKITRYPIHIEGGFAFGHGRLVPAIGGRATVEIRGRHALSTSGSFTGTPDRTRAVVLLSPRLRLDYAFSLALGAYVAAGVDFEVNGFSFVSRIAGQDRVVLEPYVARPTIEVGLSFWP
jgi:hypothetical protein